MSAPHGIQVGGLIEQDDIADEVENGRLAGRIAVFRLGGRHTDEPPVAIGHLAGHDVRAIDRKARQNLTRAVRSALNVWSRVVRCHSEMRLMRYDSICNSLDIAVRQYQHPRLV